MTAPFDPEVSFTVFTNPNGLMTKTVNPNGRGGVDKKPAAQMWEGAAETVTKPFSEFGPFLRTLKRHQAICHGVTGHDHVRVVSVARFTEQPGTITRTKEYFKYSTGWGLAMLDHDPKPRQTPLTVEQLIAAAASEWPEFRALPKWSTPSTSSCIYDMDGNKLTGEGNGCHLYFPFKPASKLPELADVLLKRMWLAGHGYIVISRAGSMLVRSIFDASVFSAERLDFVAGANCVDCEQRLPDPEYFEGSLLDADIPLPPPLMQAEENLFDALVKADKEKKRPEAEKIRAAREKQEVEILRTERGIDPEAAEAIVKARHEGHLEPGDFIQFQDGRVFTVGEILAAPEQYHGRACADPLEPEEGTSRAKLFVNNNGSVVIHSMLHGGLKYSLQAVRPKLEFEEVVFNTEDREGKLRNELSAILEKDGKLTSDVWCGRLRAEKLSPHEKDQIIAWLVEQGVGGKRVLNNEYEAWCTCADAEEAQQKLKQSAGRRVLVKYNPYNLNKVVAETEHGLVNVPGKWPFFSFGNALSYATYEAPTRIGTKKGDANPPKVPVIRQYTGNNLHLRIEQSVLHYEVKKEKDIEKPYPVPVPQQVIAKMLDNPSTLAPVVRGLVSHPVITPDGVVINKEGINPATGLILQYGGAQFWTPNKVSRKDAGKSVERIKESLFSEYRFRETPGHGDLYRTAAVALLLTGVNRRLLDNSPAGAVIANVQGTGKTTLMRSIHVVLTGRDMPVSTLSSNQDESNKAMLAMLLESPAMVCFDNVLDGFEISDPTLAKAITSPFFKGRVLGRSQEVSVPTNTLFIVNGNNITLSADLVRRFLTIQLTTDTARPEQRKFAHADVVQHTLSLRESIILDCLKITKAYIDADCPLNHDENVASSGFGMWDRMVRLPLLWACDVDVLGTFDLNREQSTEEQSMVGVMQCLWTIFGSRNFSSSELHRLLKSEHYSDIPEETVDHLRESLVLQASKALDSTRTLSFVLKKLEGRIIDGRRLLHQADKHGNRGMFCVI